MLFETTFKYAGFEINAATDDAGNYWIAQKTIADILEKERFRCGEFLAKKATKAILGDSFGVVTTSDNTNKNRANQTWVSIANFLAIMQVECQRNERAMAIVAAGFSVDFHSTLKEHFGQAMTADQKEYLRQLVFLRLANFKAWTTVIRDRHIELFGEKPTGEYYKACVEYANLQLFGVKHFNCDRDNMTTLQQETISRFEGFLIAMADKHKTACPKRLVMKALEVYHLIY